MNDKQIKPDITHFAWLFYPHFSAVERTIQTLVADIPKSVESQSSLALLKQNGCNFNVVRIFIFAEIVDEPCNGQQIQGAQVAVLSS